MPPLPTFVRGFDEAHARLSDAISGAEMPPDEAFLPLFEALNWSVALSRLAADQGVAIAAPEDDLQGLRFARNRVHHQWANALELVNITIPPPPIRGGGGGRRGGRVVMVRPASVAAWIWLDEARLPTGRPDPTGKAAYEGRLQGRPAHEVLDRLSAGLTALR
jgi:hypothetical protein